MDYTVHLPQFFDGLYQMYDAQQTAYAHQCAKFFTDLTIPMRIVQQVKAEADRVLSSDFSFFHYMPTDENALSNYLALLLDPHGSHGQQALFQDLFLKYLQTKEVEVLPTRYDVHREYSANGRIDLLLTSHDAAIIIENKPYAGDQPDQLSRYYKEIKNKYRDVAVIYLSLDSDPSAFSIETQLLEKLRKTNKFATIRLYELGETYLQTCCQRCQSDKFRVFLKDFSDFLMTHFDVSTVQGVSDAVE